VLPVYGMAALLGGRRAGLVAAWVTALYPPLAYMTGRIMSETVFIALLCTSLWLLLRAEREKSGARAVAGAAVFALSCLFRSNLLLMLPFIPLWLVLSPAWEPRRKWAAAVVGGACALAIVIAPGFYFLATRGEFIATASNAGQTFYGANNPQADGGWIRVEEHPELIASIPQSVRASSTAFGRAEYKLGLDWIRQNPGDFLRLLPKKFAAAWIPGLQKSETTSASRLASLVFILSSALLLISAIAGRLLHAPAERDGPLLAVLATYTLMSLAFYGYPRIGLFCAPVLIVFAATWLAALLRLACAGGAAPASRTAHTE
jgi:4-amino-4-deoxy-L-arabinose transferase-like glycosyltransferase